MPHDQPYLLAEKKIEEARHSGATKLASKIMNFISENFFNCR